MSRSTYSGSSNFKRRPSNSNGFKGRNSSSRFSRGSGRKKPFGKILDPEFYVQPAIKPAQVDEKNVNLSTENFQSLPLQAEIQKALKVRGYVSPTKIQTSSIPIVLNKKDLVAISQTGSGKTGAFLIPLLSLALDAKAKNQDFKTLIIAPTRELAFQIDKELHTYDMKRFGLWSQCCVGGTPMYKQIKNLSKVNQFVIGTPGRLVDLVKRKALNLSSFKAIVLDEMDRMMEMGFVEDVLWLKEQLNEDHQSLLFSATLDAKIRPVIQKAVPNAEYVEMQEQKPSLYVDQNIVRIGRNDSKLEVLLDIVSKPEVIKTLIFVNTKDMAEQVTSFLSENQHRADYIHGGKNQSSRTRVLEQFKKFKKSTLVATDVAARGLHVDDISHVINFDEPQSREDYIHRIGRTGRAGKFGIALTMVKR